MFYVFILCSHLVIVWLLVPGNHCLERLISKMSCYLSSGLLNSTHSLFWIGIWEYSHYTTEIQSVNLCGKKSDSSYSEIDSHIPRWC